MSALGFAIRRSPIQSIADYICQTAKIGPRPVRRPSEKLITGRDQGTVVVVLELVVTAAAPCASRAHASATCGDASYTCDC